MFSSGLMMIILTYRFSLGPYLKRKTIIKQGLVSGGSQPAILGSYPGADVAGWPVICRYLPT